MKYPTKYRYVAWDYDGDCYSSSEPPQRQDGLGWEYGRINCIGEYDMDNLMRETLAMERVYDMEDENDRRLIEALMNL